MSIRFGLIVIIVLIVVATNGFPVLETLTENECKSYFKSNDINLQIQALFACPKKWRPKRRKVESTMAKRSVKEKESNEEEVDDFYLFW